MISRKRIDLGIPFQDGGPDLAVLFLAIKLATTIHSFSMELAEINSLYAATKGFLATLEANSVVSLRCLQAMILVALYEYSHSIYPTAWMTVGACSRYASMLGLTAAGQTLRIIGPHVCYDQAHVGTLSIPTPSANATSNRQRGPKLKSEDVFGGRYLSSTELSRSVVGEDSPSQSRQTLIPCQ